LALDWWKAWSSGVAPLDNDVREDLLSHSPNQNVRVRYAPSPTGYLHIGGARTALFNWLFARHHDGVFILRIEDTDRKRYVEDAEDDIKDSLHWLGLDWDEGPDVGGPCVPYYQSQRAELYHEWAEWLVANGRAYRCVCSEERLEEAREAQRQRGDKPGYDRHCRDRNLGPDAGSHVIRFKMPLEGETSVHDLLRGEIIFQNADLEDLVLLKSDGLPTYHLANVVDDHFMEISHIMRADEWISTAPLHVQLYKAFGWEMPQIAHLPLILNPSGRGKLSKRNTSFQEEGREILVLVREFKEAGYLSDAVVNFLTNIGWAFGDDREIFSREEAIARFDLASVNPAPGRMPYDKLDWLNGVYIREMADDDLARHLLPFFLKAGLEPDEERVRKISPLVRERIKTLQEAVDMAGFAFRDAVSYEPSELIQKKMTVETTLAALRRSYETLEGLDDISPEAQEPVFRALAEELGLKAGQLFGALRIAVTGQQVAPPLFETMAVLGREVCLARIAEAIEALEAEVTS
jgi:glutamyl-tRNA synthetase